MHHGISYIYIYIYLSIFSIIGWVDQSKVCTLIYLQNIASCINLQLPIVNFKESIMSDIYRRKAYMYTNVQQNRISRSVKNVHINLFAKNTSCINLQIPIVILKNRAIQTLHKFATTNSNF